MAMGEAGRPHDVEAWLLRLADLAIDALREDPATWRPILGMVPGSPDVVATRIAGTREVVRQHLVAALATGLLHREGEALDTELLAHLVLATAEEIGRTLLEEPPRYSKERVLAGLRGLVAMLT